MRLFIAGGGNEKDSSRIDNLFASEVEKTKTLFYIPNAQDASKYNNCFLWFKSIFTQLGINKMMLFSDLDNSRIGNVDAAGVYIGGGNTTKLLVEMKKSGFDEKLMQLTEIDVPIYGGSAGAIVLGKTIRTAPESKDVKGNAARGLDLLQGFSVYCHYDGSEDITLLCAELNTGIIAVPERSGAYVHGNLLEVVGYEHIKIFEKEKVIILRPGEKFNLESRIKL